MQTHISHEQQKSNLTSRNLFRCLFRFPPSYNHPSTNAISALPESQTATLTPMKTPGIAAVCFEIWYQSRISVVAASGFMSAASSRILTGSIDWRAVLIVVLCTASAYWMDDYLDFSRDLRHSPTGISPRVRSAKAVAVTCAIAAALVLLYRSPFKVTELIVLIVLLTSVFWLASSRVREQTKTTHPWITFRTAYVASVWSLTTVLLPVLDRRAPINLQALAAIAFIWVLMLAVSAMWAEGEHPERHAGHLTSKPYNRALLFCCGFASLLVLFGIYRNYFPWMNIALLAACASNALFLILRRRFQQTDRRVLNEVMVLMNVFACLFVIGAYAHPNGRFGPENPRDWFQLAAFTIFYGNIAIKSAALKVRDDKGDYLDALFVLGLGLLGFQILVSVFHIEGWLFESVHWQIFNSRTASIVGAMLTIIALALQTMAYISMSASWRLMATSDEPAELITSGPFALTRNPIYVSAELYIAGTFLMNGTLVFALFVLLTPVLVHIQILREEKFLLQRHSEKYQSYFNTTARYFLF